MASVRSEEFFAHEEYRGDAVLVCLAAEVALTHATVFGSLGDGEKILFQIHI